MNLHIDKKVGVLVAGIYGTYWEKLETIITFCPNGLLLDPSGLRISEFFFWAGAGLREKIHRIARKPLYY